MKMKSIFETILWRTVADTQRVIFRFEHPATKSDRAVNPYRISWFLALAVTFRGTRLWVCAAKNAIKEVAMNALKW